MSDTADNAGLRPAFMEYRLLGERYGQLIDQIKSGRHVHAYLFSGPQGIGKNTFAKYLAGLLLCTGEQKPCGHCAHCRAVQQGNHSSVIEISPVDQKSISIDRIRELISTVSVHSLDGRERVVIIEPAESMTPQAQNCLLKSLEDPNTNVVYFILAHDASSLLDTIVSRCSAFKLAPWPADLLSKQLLDWQFPRDSVDRAIALSGGNIGEALTILQENPDSAQETALRQLLSVSSMKDAVGCSTMLKDMANHSSQILFRLERYLQQCMLVKSGILPAESLQGTPWRSAIQSASLTDLIGLSDQVFQTRKRKMSNVNWQSNVDQLACKLLEAKYKWQKS